MRKWGEEFGSKHVFACKGYEVCLNSLIFYCKSGRYLHWSTFLLDKGSIFNLSHTCMKNIIIILFVFVDFFLRLNSHCSAYELIRFCRNLSTVYTAQFFYKDPDKNIRFRAFTLLTETEEKSVSVVLILSQCNARNKYPFSFLHTYLLH